MAESPPPLERQNAIIGDGLIHHGEHTHTREEWAQMSGSILLTLIAVFIVCQAGIELWRRKHPFSFDIVSVTCLSIFPFAYFAYHTFFAHHDEPGFTFYRFLIIHTVYSVITVRMLLLSTQRPIQRSTPRLVYTWFLLSFRFSYGAAVVGYLMFMADMLGLSMMLLPASMLPLSSHGLYLITYGLYYGVVTRDIAALCTTSIASSIGYTQLKKDTITATRECSDDVCAICDTALTLKPGSTATSSAANAQQQQLNPQPEETVFTLDCGLFFFSLSLLHSISDVVTFYTLRPSIP